MITQEILKKIVIIGSSCSGKTTFSKRLSVALGIKHVELDALFWKPNWQETAIDEFKNRVADSLKDNSWVVDGDYRGQIIDIVWSQADTIIWLNPPFYKILARFFFRSIRRAWTSEVLWDGCKESLKNTIFQRNSLLLYILKTHRSKMARYTALMLNPPYQALIFYRLRSESEVENFLQNFCK